jgi:hypothetical protein
MMSRHCIFAKIYPARLRCWLYIDKIAPKFFDPLIDLGNAHNFLIYFNHPDSDRHE